MRADPDRSVGRCPRRSIAGWSIAECRRCPGGCRRIAKTRCRWRPFSIRIRASRGCIIPGSPSHPQHDLAQRQMSSFGGDALLRNERRSRGGDGAAEPHQIFTRATSLGGVESLIEHRASIEGPDTRTPETLLRLSIGLEHPDDLIADLDRALALIPRARYSCSNFGLVSHSITITSRSTRREVPAVPLHLELPAHERDHVMHFRDAQQVGGAKKRSGPDDNREQHLHDQFPLRRMSRRRQKESLRDQTNRGQHRAGEKNLA